MKKDKGSLILDKFLADVTVAHLAGDKEKVTDLIFAFTNDIAPYPNKKQLVDIAMHHLASLNVFGADLLNDLGDTIQ
jgi:hypothetical protein